MDRNHFFFLAFLIQLLTSVMLHCKPKTYLRLATSAAFRGFPGGAGTRTISGVIFLGIMKLR